MKKILTGLLATPLLIASCNNIDLGEPIVWGNFSEEGTAVAKYGGTLETGFSLDTKLPQTTVTNHKYDHALEMRLDDQLIINLPTGHGLNFNDKNGSKYKFEDHIISPASSKLEYCPDKAEGVADLDYKDGLLIKSGNRLVNKAFLTQVHPAKVSKELVDLSMLFKSDFTETTPTDTVTDEEYQQGADNYSVYLDSIGLEWREQFMNCKNIGEGLKYPTLVDYFKASDWNTPAILTFGNSFFFEMKDNKVAFGISGEWHQNDFGGIEYIADLADKTNKQYVSPSLGINLHKGTDYLRTNWLSNVNNSSSTIIGKY